MNVKGLNCNVVCVWIFWNGDIKSMMEMLKLFIIVGILFIVVGLVWKFIGRFLGDIFVKKGNVIFYFFIIICIVLSIVLFFIMYIINWFK